MSNIVDRCYDIDESIARAAEENDRVNHPAHYAWLKDVCGVEVIDITRHLNFDLGNVVKYVLRAGRKTEGGMDIGTKLLEDLEKARFYLDDEIRRLKKEMYGEG